MQSHVIEAITYKYLTCIPPHKVFKTLKIISKVDSRGMNSLVVSRLNCSVGYRAR